MTAPVPSAAPLATAVVGCGVIGKTHVTAVLELDRLRLCTLVDEAVDWRGTWGLDGGGALMNHMGRRGGGNQAEHHRDPAEPALEGIDASRFTLGHIRQYHDLLAAVDGAGAPGVTVDDALLALATVRAVYVSAATGEKVAVADVLAGRHDDVAPGVPRRLIAV